MKLFGSAARQPSMEEGLRMFRDTPGAILLDVRSPEEYESGHIPDSVNLPLNRLAAITYPKEAPLFVYCHSGARSSRACGWLTGQGYSAVNLGGMLSYQGTVE